jgi:antitoxin HicB
MRLELAYPALFTPDEEGRILVKFIDLPHTATDGKDQAEAMAEAIDCLASVLSISMSLREEIPSPSRSRCGAVLVPVSLDVAPKLALYQAMRAAKIGNSELARRIGVTEAVVRRMLDPAHKTKALKLQAALEALGTRLVISTEAA